MFTLTAALVALAAYVSAAPTGSVVVGSSPSHIVSGSNVHSLPGFSLSGWGGFESLNNFDDFWGSSNFCGNNNVQTVLSQTVVCHSEEVVVIQQQLAILQEFAKRIIVEQVCEVEVQTIIWQQFVSSFSSFGDDLRHISGRSIGYDHNIASHISGLVDSSNNIITSDFGFHGLDVGQNIIAPSGFNWVSGSSELSVQQAFLASQSAQLVSNSNFLGGSSFGHGSSLGGFSGLGGGSQTFNVGSL